MPCRVSLWATFRAPAAMSHRPAYLTGPTISIAYLQVLLEILAERGFEGERLLAGTGLPARLLQDPEGRMSARQWTRLVMRALELTGDPGLGIAYGLRMRPTAHGVLGYATMTCSTLRQAVELSMRYSRVRQAHFTFHLAEDGDDGMLEVREKYAIPVLRSFFVENVLVGLARALAMLLGEEVTGIDGLEIWFDWPEPSYHAHWRHRLPRVRYGMPVNALRLPRRFLDRRPVLADPHASRQAIELCERELVLAADHEADIMARVRAQLVAGRTGGYPQLDEVAVRMHMSPRTLKRRLQQVGSSFLLLLEEARRRDAHELLVQTDLPVQAVAERLGYLNPANFSRAFSRWTGESPAAYRARRRGG